jgi:hypothetical protein
MYSTKIAPLFNTSTNRFLKVDFKIIQELATSKNISVIAPFDFRRNKEINKYTAMARVKAPNDFKVDLFTSYLR